MLSTAFTPPDGSLLVLCLSWDENSTADNVVWTITGGSLTWTTQVERNGNDAGATAGGAAIITAPVTTGASMQVTVTRNTGGGTQSRQMSAKVYIVTGEHASPIGANGEGSSTTNNLSPTLFAATGAGRAFYCGTDWSQRGAPTSTDTEDSGDYSGMISCMSAYKASDHTSGSISGNLDGGGTSACDWNWVALEILSAGGAPAATSLPPHALRSPTHFLMR